MSLSADGQLLAYTSFASSETMQSVALDPTTATVRGEPVTIIAGSRPFTFPSPSPDGRWLVFASGTPNRALEIYSFETSRYTRLYDCQSVNNALWLNNGRRLLFDEGSKLRLIDSQTGSIRDLLSIAPDIVAVTGLSRDNRIAYVTRRASQADIWLMTLK